MRVGTLRVQLADDNVITDGWDTKVAVMKASRYGVLEASIYIHISSTTTSRRDGQRQLSNNSLSILYCTREAGN